MRKHTILEYINLWVSNLKYRRLLPVKFAQCPFGRSATWFDLLFVSFCVLDVVAKDLLSKKKIPATVILVGAPFSMKEWDNACEWAIELAKKHPEMNLAAQ